MDSVLDQYVDAHANMVVYLTNSIIQVVNNLTFSLLSQAIQWWRVSRADLHAHPQLITVPPEVHACPSPPSLQIGSRDRLGFKRLGTCFGSLSCQWIEFSLAREFHDGAFFFLTLLITASNSCCY